MGEWNFAVRRRAKLKIVSATGSARGYLHSFYKRCLLYIGDVHGSQGDGEWSVIANKVRAEARMHCNFMKNKKLRMHALKKRILLSLLTLINHWKKL